MLEIIKLGHKVPCDVHGCRKKVANYSIGNPKFAMSSYNVCSDHMLEIAKNMPMEIVEQLPKEREYEDIKAEIANRIKAGVLTVEEVLDTLGINQPESEQEKQETKPRTRKK